MVTQQDSEGSGPESSLGPGVFRRSLRPVQHGAATTKAEQACEAPGARATGWVSRGPAPSKRVGEQQPLPPQLGPQLQNLTGPQLQNFMSRQPAAVLGKIGEICSKGHHSPVMIQQQQILMPRALGEGGPCCQVLQAWLLGHEHPDRSPCSDGHQLWGRGPGYPVSLTSPLWGLFPDTCRQVEGTYGTLNPRRHLHRRGGLDRVSSLPPRTSEWVCMWRGVFKEVMR